MSPIPTRPLQADGCPAYILAGGRSLRFGSDKALVDLGGEVLLQQLRRWLVTEGHAVHVVADRCDRYDDLGLNCLVDRIVGAGPLAGLATALGHRQVSGAGWLLLLSCDQLRWSESWFCTLAAAAREGLQIVASTGGAAGVMQPMPGLYHTRLLPRVLQGLSESRRSLQALWDPDRCVAVGLDQNPRQWSFNTPQELAQIQLADQHPDPGDGG